MNGEYKNEEWRAVSGYEGRYEISNYGRVKNVKLNHILKPLLVIGGYFRVDLSSNNNVKHFRLHKLVAEAFIPNPNNLPQINHKDENKSNNRADNLEWCTAKYNANYGTAIKRRVEHTNYKNRSNEKKYKPILQFTLDNVFVKRWKSAFHCEQETNMRATGIRGCCRGVYKSSHGFLWRYEHE